MKMAGEIAEEEERNKKSDNYRYTTTVTSLFLLIDKLICYFLQQF
jgi:hypothetical protein